MTEPRERQKEATVADPEPEVEAEVIQDLDAKDDDVEVKGGCYRTYTTTAAAPTSHIEPRNLEPGHATATMGSSTASLNER